MRTPKEQAAFVASVRRKRGIGSVSARQVPVVNRGAMKSLAILYPCMHRGGQVDAGTCRTCSGSIAVPVLSCAMYERCTSHHLTEHDVPICQLCRDRRQAPEEIPLAGFLNRFKGRTAWVFGRGENTFDHAKIADITDPCFFINEAVALDRYVSHDDCFWFALDAKHEYLLTSMRSLPVLHRDGWARPGNWAGLRRVCWWTQATKQGPVLDRSREDTARLRELHTNVGTIQPLIHFAWLCGIDRLMLVGCDGLDPNGDGNYDARLPDHSLKRPGASYSRIRHEQDKTMAKLGIAAEYVGTPVVKVKPRPPGDAVKLPDDLKSLTGPTLTIECWRGMSEVIFLNRCLSQIGDADGQTCTAVLSFDAPDPQIIARAGKLFGSVRVVIRPALPTIVAFYTVGTRYEAEAARLRRSLDRLGLKHDIRGVPDRGSWALNAGLTAGFLCDMLREHAPNPIVYLNADAVVWKRPDLFTRLAGDGYDLAAHRAVRGHLNNGTLWLSNSPVCREVITDYRQRIEANAGDRDEQRFLDEAIRANPAAKLGQLPESYCFIHDLMQSPAEEAVIEHLQASREAKAPGRLLESRRRRLAELEAQGV